MENAGCTRDLLNQLAESRMNSNHANTRTFKALLLWGNGSSLLWTKNTNVQVFKLSTISIYHLNSIWILGFLGFILDFVAKYSWAPSKNLNKSKYWTVESLRPKQRWGKKQWWKVFLRRYEFAEPTWDKCSLVRLKGKGKGCYERDNVRENTGDNNELSLDT